MKFLQFRGPFAKGETLTVSPPQASYADDVSFVYRHIGIQIPEKQPIIQAEEADKSKIRSALYGADIKINNIECRVSSTGLLEFDNIYLSTCVITFLKALDANTIIDIGYETA
jgi:hypothetical protein